MAQYSQYQQPYYPGQPFIPASQQQAQQQQAPQSQTPPPQQQQSGGAPPSKMSEEATQRLHSLLAQLLNPDTRATALHELSKQRESFPDLAPTMWYTTGCLAVLLQEIISAYPCLNPPTLQTQMSNRVCNALALIQVMAAHPDTRAQFLHAQLPLYLYPYLNTLSGDRPFEYLRLTSLGVIGALVKADELDVIRFLLSTEIVPLCLKIMEKGTELSRTVATFIVQKILAIELGLSYICATPERFMAVATVLRSMVAEQNCSSRLLRHIIRCYLHLTDHARAREALKQCLPDQLRNDTFGHLLQEDPNMKKWLFQLLVNVGDPGALGLQEQQHMVH